MKLINSLTDKYCKRQGEIEQIRTINKPSLKARVLENRHSSVHLVQIWMQQLKTLADQWVVTIKEPGYSFHPLSLSNDRIK